MMLSILILTISATTFTASAAMNPLTMGLLILLMALLLSITFAMSMSSWIAMLIFLIYIGGMLVMFSYFVAITPNQNLSFMTLLAMLLSSMFSIMFIAFMLNMTTPINLNYVSQTNIMYEKFNIPVLITLALVLLFTMVVVVKVSIHNKGPLRPFLKYV